MTNHVFDTRLSYFTQRKSVIQSIEVFTAISEAYSVVGKSEINVGFVRYGYSIRADFTKRVCLCLRSFQRFIEHK